MHLRFSVFDAVHGFPPTASQCRLLLRDFDGGGGVEGWDDAADSPNVTATLMERGYSEQDIEKNLGRQSFARHARRRGDCDQVGKAAAAWGRKKKSAAWGRKKKSIVENARVQADFKNWLYPAAPSRSVQSRLFPRKAELPCRCRSLPKSDPRRNCRLPTDLTFSIFGSTYDTLRHISSACQQELSVSPCIRLQGAAKIFSSH